MFAEALRIALRKAAGSAAEAALKHALADAEHLAAFEADFENKVNASKARRGEPPTKLSKKRRVDIDEYASDAATLQAKQLAAFEQDASAFDIVASLNDALDRDIAFWATATKYAHRDEHGLIQAFVEAKRALHASLERSLADLQDEAANGLRGSN